MPRSGPKRLAKLTLIAYAISFASLWLFAGHGDGQWILGAITYFWVISPLALTTLLVGISRTRRWEWIVTGFTGLMILSTVGAWYTFLVVNPDPMSAITLIIFLPLAQYLAVVLFLCIAAPFGWKAKDSWLRD